MKRLGSARCVPAFVLAAALHSACAGAGEAYVLDPAGTQVRLAIHVFPGTVFQARLSVLRGSVRLADGVGDVQIDARMDSLDLGNALATKIAREVLDTRRFPSMHFEGSMPRGALTGTPSVVQGTVVLGGAAAPISMRMSDVHCGPLAHAVDECRGSLRGDFPVVMLRGRGPLAALVESIELVVDARATRAVGGGAV